MGHDGVARREGLGGRRPKHDGVVDHHRQHRQQRDQRNPSGKAMPSFQNQRERIGKGQDCRTYQVGRMERRCQRGCAYGRVRLPGKEEIHG